MEPFEPDEWNPEPPEPRRRKIPPHTVIISFSMFCTQCGKELRAATIDDRAGDNEMCSSCGLPVRALIGIAVHANTKAELQYTMSEMQQNINLIHKVLSEWGSPSDGKD